MKLSLFFYTGANLVGLCLYTISVKAIQHTMRIEERQYSDFGDSLNFTRTALPVLLVCLLLNIVWGITGMRDAARDRGCRSIVACVIVVAAWTTTILVGRRFS